MLSLQLMAWGWPLKYITYIYIFLKVLNALYYIPIIAIEIQDDNLIYFDTRQTHNLLQSPGHYTVEQKYQFAIMSYSSVFLLHLLQRDT